MNREIRVGLIVNTHGLKGELRVYPLTDYKERFEEINNVYIEDEDHMNLYIEKVRYKNDLVILKFKNLDHINDVEKYKNKYIHIYEEKLRQLPEDTYYIIDLIGSQVYDEYDNYLGNISNVIQNAAQDIYEIKLNSEKNLKNNTLLVPAVKEFIKEIDLENRKVIIRLIEGMLE